MTETPDADGPSPAAAERVAELSPPQDGRGFGDDNLVELDVSSEDTEDEPVVVMTEESLGGSRNVRNRDSALDGGLPLLMVHREHRHWKLLTPLVNELHRTSAHSLSLGVVANLPRMTAAAASTYLTGAARASVRIADPEVYTRDDMWGPMLLQERDGPPRPPAAGQPAAPPRTLMPQTAQQWAYWAQPLPAGPTEAWVAEVLQAQRGAGANLLLTPGVPLRPQAAAADLQALEQQTGWARAQLQAGERLAANVTVEAIWLADRRLRTLLLNHIVESDEDVWYVRVKWPLLAATYGQLMDAAVLDGYQELASFMEDEQRVLLLPTSGGTGWVSLAWGAAGFGTGIGSGARGFTTGRPIRMKEPPPRTPRYFERALLHTIDATTADALARMPGYVPCQCRYCAHLRNAPTWDYGMSGAHYLLTIGELTGSLAGGSGKRAVARRTVRAAERYRSQVNATVPLTGNDSAAHLAIWLGRLR